MAAHLGRANMLILQIASLLIPFTLIWKSKISARVVQLLLVLYGFEWIRILIYYARTRMENDEDWIRLAIILGVVAILNFATIFSNNLCASPLGTTQPVLLCKTFSDKPSASETIHNNPMACASNTALQNPSDLLY